MNVISYLLGKKAGGGGGNSGLEFNNPLTEDVFYKNITKIPRISFSGTTCINMFNGFINLQSVDVSDFDTSNVASYNGIFQNCSSLTELDLSSFGESAITTFANMFNGCTNLKKINLSNLKTTQDVANNSNVTNVFNNCSALEELDMRSFNFKKFSSSHIDYFFAYSGLKNVLIIVKDNEQKNYIVTNASVGLENVKTVAELNE